MLEHFESFSIDVDGVGITVNMSRTNANLDKAQKWLDLEVFKDSDPYMPKRDALMRDLAWQRTKSLAGTGEIVVAAQPYGRFQYMGKVMVDPLTGSPWARKDAKKVVTNRDLKYSNPQATPRWFETAKSVKLQHWIDGVNKEMGNG